MRCRSVNFPESLFLLCPQRFSGVKIAALLCLIQMGSQAVAQTSPRVEQAITFLKAACVTGGSSLDLRIGGDGSLQINSIQNAGIHGTITLTKKELEGFADAASELAAQQASEMRSCMKPHVDRILSALLSGGSAGSPASVTIQTDGNYFVAAEFDKVLAAASTRPDHQWNIEPLARDANVHPAKVRFYLEIASDNKLGYYSPNFHTFQLNRKGVNYVLSRDLVN